MSGKREGIEGKGKEGKEYQLNSNPTIVDLGGHFGAFN